MARLWLAQQGRGQREYRKQVDSEQRAPCGHFCPGNGHNIATPPPTLPASSLMVLLCVRCLGRLTVSLDRRTIQADRSSHRDVKSCARTASSSCPPALSTRRWREHTAAHQGAVGSQLHGSRKGAGLLLLAPYTLAARTEKASKCKAVPKNAFCRAMLAPSTLVWCSQSRSSPWQRLVKDAEKEAEGRCKSYGRAQRKAYLKLRYVLRKSSSKKLSPHSREPRSLVRHPPCWWCPGASCMPHVTLARRRMPPAVRARAFAA